MNGLTFRIIVSYVLDYVIIIGLIVAFYILDRVEPYHQHFSLRNYTLQYPYAVHERVPVPHLIAIACGGPIVVMAIYTLIVDGIFSHRQARSSTGKKIRPYTLKQRLWELNCGILGLGLSVSAAFTITGTLKNAIGKPRPDLIDRCQPIPGSEDPPVYGLSSHAICTQTDNDILKDGFRSFPSGHSSSAFAGLFYLSIYLAAKLHVLDSKGEVWKTFIVLVPTLGAALIAGSRIMDARHHPFDVITGSMLGMLTAWGAYRQYFPPVSETWRKGRAYPIRSWGSMPKQPPRYTIDDEERDSADDPRRDNDVVAAHGGNVFRAQIYTSQSDRARQQGLQQRKGPGAEEDESRLPFYASPSIGVTPASPVSESDPIKPYRSRPGEFWGGDDEAASGYELREQGSPLARHESSESTGDDREGPPRRTLRDAGGNLEDFSQGPRRQFSFEPAR